ncbi:MAG: tRNA (adenosine(37)-N6)-threonylcarbamoyltransferase complex transferase subunit TsaD [Aquabacterium sp.]|nr:tRNA (adenosine(37)-N6)-threonylcarbamoyltransferase complex transferase subunit TsaD [Aquabacterium sp.]
MKVLGIESSCDETGVALVETADAGVPILRAHALHSQVQLHEAYGGVVPELASRDHIRRVLPLTAQVLEQAGCTLRDLDVVAYTRGPGLAGALLVGAGVACALAAALGLPTLGVHHLEGHLLSPFLSADPPGLGYPGGPALAELAAHGDPAAYALPRPLLHSGDLDFSFAGLKTAVLTQVRRLGDAPNETQRANLAASTQAAIVEVLVKKSLAALKATGLARLVVSGGVGANRELRRQLDAACTRRRVRVHYPELALCTDNGAMIALAAAMRLQAGRSRAVPDYGFAVRPRWPLQDIG